LTGSLDASGAATSTVQSNNLPFNDALPGGQVTVSGGYVVLVPDSVIDVSGASGLSSLGAAGSGNPFGGRIAGASTASTFPVASAGGTVSISAVLGAILEGKLLGQSGGGNASGGTLNVALAPHGGSAEDPTTNGGPWPNTEDTYIVLEQTISASPYYLSKSQIGVRSFPSIDAHIPVSVQMVASGGFASLVLNAPSSATADPIRNAGNGYITFSGNTSLLPQQSGQPTLDTLTLNTGTIIVPDNTTQTLGANYIQWNNKARSSPARAWAPAH
jgi:hypothetical protein